MQLLKLFSLMKEAGGGGGGGHFHSKVIGMLVVFFRVYKILTLVFLGSSGKFLEN